MQQSLKLCLNNYKINFFDYGTFFNVLNGFCF